MKVLYAVDGSAPSVDAGRLLAKLADPRRVEVTVASISPHTEGGTGSDPKRVHEMLDEAASAIVERAAASLEENGLDVARHVSHGRPGEEIVRLIRRDWFDVTVLGAGNRSWLGNTLLGSTSTYVLHSSPSSVLIVHEGPSEQTPAPILLGTDGSRSAALATETVAGLIRPDACRVTALSVALDPGPPVDLWPVPTGDPDHVAAAESAQRTRLAEVETTAREAAEVLGRAGIEARHKGVLGNPTIEILKEADGGAYDLVVIGSRGLGPVQRVLLGSVSDQVARHARATLVARMVV
jgi:nucleotide-binding universal stress UspA family protein